MAVKQKVCSGKIAKMKCMWPIGLYLCVVRIALTIMTRDIEKKKSVNIIAVSLRTHTHRSIHEMHPSYALIQSEYTVKLQLFCDCFCQWLSPSSPILDTFLFVQRPLSCTFDFALGAKKKTHTQGTIVRSEYFDEINAWIAYTTSIWPKGCNSNVFLVHAKTVNQFHRGLFFCTRLKAKSNIWLGATLDGWLT